MSNYTPGRSLGRRRTTSVAYKVGDADVVIHNHIPAADDLQETRDRKRRRRIRSTSDMNRFNARFWHRTRDAKPSAAIALQQPSLRAMNSYFAKFYRSKRA
jgi:hypothetical protein